MTRRAKSVSAVTLVATTTEAEFVAQLSPSWRHLADEVVVVDRRDPAHRQFDLGEFGSVFRGPPDTSANTALAHAYRQLRNASDYVLFLSPNTLIEIESDYDTEALKQTLNRSVYFGAYDLKGRRRSLPTLLHKDYDFALVGDVRPYVVTANVQEAVGELEGLIFRVAELPLDVEQFESAKRSYAAAADRDEKEHYARLLAETELGAGRIHDAFEWFGAAAANGRNADQVSDALTNAGKLAEANGQTGQALDYFMRAHDVAAHRAEPLYYAARLARASNRISLAYMFARAASRRPRDNATDYIEEFVYEWGALLELSIAAYYSNEFNEGFDACRRILALDGLSKEDRELTRANLAHYLRALNLTGA